MAGTAVHRRCDGVTHWRCDSAEAAHDVSAVVGGREEVFPPSGDLGVDRSEAWISVKHTLNFESSLVLSPLAQECQMGITHSPRGQWVLGYLDIKAPLRSGS